MDRDGHMMSHGSGFVVGEISQDDEGLGPAAHDVLR